jgi:hypothetical protein
LDEGITCPLQSYSQIFEECFPFYLSIGMSSAEYWDGDNELPRYYRKAYKMKQEQMNHEAWLNGLYVYDAVVSAMTHLNQNKSSHKSYAPEPYSFTKEDIERENEQKVAEAEARAEVWMKSWVSATQGMFKNK